MATKLSRNASGSRHLRWGREVHASIRAHLEINDLLTPAQRALLTTESATVEGLLGGLAAAVTPYRNFVDHAHVELRAKQRVGNHLCDVAQKQADGQMRPYRKTINEVLPGGFQRILSKLPLSRVLRAGHKRTAQLAIDAAVTLRGLPPSIPGTGALADRLDLVGDRLNKLVEDGEKVLSPQRAPLKIAVERAIFELREGLEKMDARLRELFDVDFIDSLYPELSRGGTAVADEDAEDDDDAGAPDGEG